MSKQVQYNYWVADTENTVPKPKVFDNGELSIEGNSKSTFVWAFSVCPVMERPEPENVTIFDSVPDSPRAKPETTVERFFKWANKLDGNNMFYFHNLGYDCWCIVDYLVKHDYKQVILIRDYDAVQNALLQRKTDFSELDAIDNSDIEVKKSLAPGDFTVSVSGEGKWYSLTIRLKHSRKLMVIRDSLKILPFSLNYLASSKGLDTKYKKLIGSIDYAKQREPGYRITNKERKYIENDVLVLSEAIDKVRRLQVGAQTIDLTDRLTIGSACMKMFITMLGNGNYKNGKNRFDILFPKLDIDTETVCRDAYQGAFCCNFTAGEIIDDDEVIFIFDVTSLYPYSMHTNTIPAETDDDFNFSDHKFPVKQPYVVKTELFEQYQRRDETTYIVNFDVEASVKDNCIPWLQFHDSRWIDKEYVRNTHGIVNLTMTEPSFELFKSTYDITYFKVKKLLVFEAVRGIFDEYIDFFFDLKSKTKSKVIRLIAKLFLNNLYGKFATNPRGTMSYVVQRDGVATSTSAPILKPGGYIPVGAFITSYARAYTIRAGNENIDKILYCDTDSWHMRGVPNGWKLVDGELVQVHKSAMFLDDNILGAWKLEGIARKGRYVRQKTYAEWLIKKDEYLILGEIENESLDIKACGCPDNVKERLLYHVEPWVELQRECYTINGELTEIVVNKPRTWDDVLNRFTFGLVETGKSIKRRVDGGSILLPGKFEIHENKRLDVDTFKRMDRKDFYDMLHNIYNYSNYEPTVNIPLTDILTN